MVIIARKCTSTAPIFVLSLVALATSSAARFLNVDDLCLNNIKCPGDLVCIQGECRPNIQQIDRPKRPVIIFPVTGSSCSDESDCAPNEVCIADTCFEFNLADLFKPQEDVQRKNQGRNLRQLRGEACVEDSDCGLYLTCQPSIDPYVLTCQPAPTFDPAP